MNLFFRFAFLALVLVGTTTWAKQAQVSDFVKGELKAQGRSEIFVILKSQADLSGAKRIQDRVARLKAVYRALVQHANQSQAGVMTTLTAAASKKRGLRVQRFFITNAILVQGADAELVNALSYHSDVKKIVGNKSSELLLPIQTESLSPFVSSGVGDNITASGAEQVWNQLSVRGENIVIAGQDTGYQWDHPALKQAYRGFKNGQVMHDYNWFDAVKAPFATKLTAEGRRKAKLNKCGYDIAAPCDDDQHGTHTMGTMVGSDGGQNQIGVAPKAKWIGCRNMDSGTGKPASYLACFQFFLAPTPVKGDPFTTGRPEYAPHVINNSWGCPGEEGCTGDEMIPALQALTAAGIMVVVSAGNDGNKGCSSINAQPATHTQWILSVGAYNHRNNRIAGFSSRGPSAFNGQIGPDLVAPGVSIRSSVPGSGYDGGMWSGTSMAGPHVAGAVALIWSANPKYVGQIDATKALLQKTSLGMTSSETCGGVSGSAVPNNTYGFGIMRIFEAVKSAVGR